MQIFRNLNGVHHLPSTTVPIGFKKVFAFASSSSRFETSAAFFVPEANSLTMEVSV